MTNLICSKSIREINLFPKMFFTFSPPFCHSFRFVGGNALFSTEDYRCPGHGATDPVLPKAMTFTSALSGTVIVLMKWKKEMGKLQELDEEREKEGWRKRDDEIKSEVDREREREKEKECEMDTSRQREREVEIEREREREREIV